MYRIVFLREFRVLGSHSAYQSLSGHKEKEYLGAFGEPFVPEFVYTALREIQRFASMRVSKPRVFRTNTSLIPSSEAINTMPKSSLAFYSMSCMKSWSACSKPAA